MNAWLLELWSAALLAGLSTVAGDTGPGAAPIADRYAQPGEMVQLGGRRALNLRCSGTGEPVVVLEAGANAESSTWYRVQPQLARLTRTCSYDRAGYGYSDEGPYPRDLAADVADLHALVRAADLPTPVVLVGHSLGSNIVRRFAQLHPDAVAGLVLVDPPEQGSEDRMPQDWQAQVTAGLAQREALLGACERAAVAGDLDTIQQQCLRPPPPWMGERVAAATLRNKARPAYWRTLRSELAHNDELFAVPVPADESYGAIPLVLLAATTQDDGVPDAVRAVIEANRRDTHARILAASTDSRVIEVPGSSHDVQLDRPEAVVSAVKRLLGTRARSDEP